jgi:hypothetical protein
MIMRIRATVTANSDPFSGAATAIHQSIGSNTTAIAPPRMAAIANGINVPKMRRR